MSIYGLDLDFCDWWIVVPSSWLPAHSVSSRWPAAAPSSVLPAVLVLPADVSAVPVVAVETHGGAPRVPASAGKCSPEWLSHTHIELVYIHFYVQLRTVNI